MKKILLIIILGSFLVGCASTTTTANLNSGKTKIGMTKGEFCYEHNSLSSKKNPCNLTFSEMMAQKPRGAYYPETKMEIMYDLVEESYFVFENVTIPHDWYDPWKSWIPSPKNLKGDGTLVKIFKDLDEAKNFASGANFSVGTDKVQKAKQACINQGFTTGTEEFAECSLKKLKEQSQ